MKRNINVKYKGKEASILLFNKNKVIKISISKIIKINPKMKNCKEKGGRLVKMFSIPHSNGKFLVKFLLFSSFKRIGNKRKRAPITVVRTKVIICVIIWLS